MLSLTTAIRKSFVFILLLVLSLSSVWSTTINNNDKNNFDNADSLLLLTNYRRLLAAHPLETTEATSRQPIAKKAATEPTDQYPRVWELS